MKEDADIRYLYDILENIKNKNKEKLIVMQEKTKIKIKNYANKNYKHSLNDLDKYF